MKIKNYGWNVSFSPKHFYQPQTEQEVLDILNKHKDGQIRAQGSLHAWSKAAASDDAFLDIKELKAIEITRDNDVATVSVGGGCKLTDLIQFLAKENLTIPAMGGITLQSVAGLASTATHGAGKSSFSHYIKEIRIAAYDPTTGEAKIYEYTDGDELRAARAAIGCMGIILSMKIQCLPRYWIEEHFTQIKTLDEVLALEEEWPLQSFALSPYSWNYIVFKRRVSQIAGNAFSSWLSRIRDVLMIEWMSHALLKIILKFGDKAVIWYYRSFSPRALRDTLALNLDYQGLTLHTLHHYRFRHVEMEMFIPEPHLRAVVGTLKEVIEWFAGLTTELSPDFQQQLINIGMYEHLASAKGKYVHHYPLFFRKVHPDDAMISMTAGNQSYYAIGVFTYFKEENRGDYYKLCQTLAPIMNKLYGARLHWGKHFPLTHAEIAPLYPEMEKFKALCKQVDPNGVFQNDFTKSVLGE